MSSVRRVAGLAVALAILAAAVAPEVAGAARKYRFSFTAKLHMDWQWPPNPNNGGQRAAQAFEVLGGRGCGTRPSRAVWRIRDQTPGSGLGSSTLKIRVPGNPAQVADARYFAGSAAEVQAFLRFSRSTVTLAAVPHGDVAGLEIGPGTATIRRTRVARC